MPWRGTDPRGRTAPRLRVQLPRVPALYRLGLFLPGHLCRIQEFCTTCGSVVLMRAEALKEAISVSAGCLEDRDFPPPQLLHWAQRKHRWLCLPGIDAAAPA
uniref:GFA family protein n=1 Tax=Cupriavidus gilardii TaxID=82541 RepID=UPI001D0437EA|nr:GFA family protein [Cupriavidus gilardii]